VETGEKRRGGEGLEGGYQMIERGQNKNDEPVKKLSRTRKRLQD